MREVWFLIFMPDHRYNFSIFSPTAVVMALTDDPDAHGVPREAVAYAVEHPGMGVKWEGVVGREVAAIPRAGLYL
jgi:hypothetical protein